MKKIFLIILIIATSFLWFSSGYVQDEIGEELKLYLGELKLIPVSNPTRIAIGNPEIADVVHVTREEITISPKAKGKTTLVFWDDFGEQSYQIKVFVEDIDEIKRRVDNLLGKLNLPDIYTQAEEEEGKVLILGQVKKPQNRERIALALGALKDKTLDLVEVKEEEAVVEIDVLVLELNEDATKTLGFTMPGQITASETAGRFSKALRASMDAIFHVFDWPRSDFTMQLDMLVQEGKARILSRPRLACQSGKEAELLVGGEKPIFTTSIASTLGTSTNVEYKEYGIKLKVKPTVIEEGRIKLALNVEVTEVGTAEYIGPTTDRTAQAYPLTKRSASTELYLNDGQTMAIGGLMKQKKEEDIHKTAFLGDIPILGLLFRKKTTRIGGGQGERGNVELFITLTPTIVSEKKKVIRELTREIGSQMTSPALVAPTLAASAQKNLFEPATEEYTQLIQECILENLSYPSLAKEVGFQGTVRLSLHLSAWGELLEVRVKDSSGHQMLDDHAVSVAKKVISYPPLPSSIRQEELWVEVPIVYKLD